MTDGIDQALTDAGLNLLRADTGLTVYDGKAAAGAVPPYVLVYTHIERPSDDEDNSGDGRSRVWVARWICHCVGGGEDGVAARAVAQRVRTQLLDVSPTVAGLSCGRIRLEQSDPASRDESTGGLEMTAVVVYRLRAAS